MHTNEDGIAKGINPIDYSPSVYTDVMKTVPLKQALDKYGFDAAFGGARRDEEASRAKERVFSFRAEGHRWDPRRQRPEMWRLLNGRLGAGETVRVFPLSNWTERDIWRYILREKLDVVPLYFAAERPTVVRNGQLLVVDDNRLPIRDGRGRQAAARPLPHAGLLSAHRRRRIRCRRHRKRRRGDAGRAHLRTRGPPDRPRSGRRHGKEKAGRVLLMSAQRAEALKVATVTPLHAELKAETKSVPKTSTKPRAAASKLAPALDGVSVDAIAPELSGMLRVLTCGSVDDGKSTLIGRLLVGRD